MINLAAFCRLLNMKICSADKKASNPFLNPGSYNPFSRPIYTTIVWVDPQNPDKDDRT